VINLLAKCYLQCFYCFLKRTFCKLFVGFGLYICIQKGLYIASNLKQMQSLDLFLWYETRVCWYYGVKPLYDQRDLTNTYNDDSDSD
jgi:hypothetical protein